MNIFAKTLKIVVWFIIASLLVFTIVPLASTRWIQNENWTD